MNKRIFLFLLPVLALILSGVNGKADSSAFFSKTAQGYTFSSTHQSDVPYSVALNKDNNRKHKNAIRIKAWDDAAAVVPAIDWIPVTKICYFTRPVYWNHCSPTLSFRFYRHKLRGPPVV